MERCLQERRHDLYISAVKVYRRHCNDLGGIAQLARAPALQAGGQRFESVYLHLEEIIDMLETQNLNYSKEKAIHREGATPFEKRESSSLYRV